MAKTRMLSRSHEEQSFAAVYEYWQDAIDGLRELFDAADAYPRFWGMSLTELEQLLDVRREELERQATLALLSSIEAAFQVDYHARVRRRGKDSVSRAFRQQTVKNRASLERDIVPVWEEALPFSRPLFKPLRNALQYRHWLAHGRYWVHRGGRPMFNDLYESALLLKNSLELVA